MFRLDKAYGGVEQRRVTLTFDPQGRLANIEQEGDFSEDLPLEGESSMGPATEGVDPMDALPEESTQTPIPPSAQPVSQP